MRPPRRGRPYRVLLTVPAGKAERTTAELRSLLRRLDRRHFEPIVCSLDPESPLTGELRRQGVTAFSLAEDPGRGLRGLWRRTMMLAHILHSREIEVVHTFQDRDGLLARLATRVMRHPPAVITHHPPRGSARSARLALALRLTRGLSARCVVASTADRDELIEREGVPLARIVVIPASLDAARSTAEHAHLYATLAGVRRRSA